MFINVHMVALSFRFTKLSVQCNVHRSIMSLRFTKLFVQCDVHHSIMSLLFGACIFVPSLAIHGGGVGETDIRRPLDPARPWALLLGTPRFAVVGL